MPKQRKKSNVVSFKKRGNAIKAKRALRPKTTKGTMKKALHRSGRRTTRAIKGPDPLQEAVNYNKAYDAGFDEAYNEGFNIGYPEGLAAGHQETNKGD